MRASPVPGSRPRASTPGAHRPAAQHRVAAHPASGPNRIGCVMPAHAAGRQPGPRPPSQHRRRRSSCQLRHRTSGRRPGRRPGRRRGERASGEQAQDVGDQGGVGGTLPGQRFWISGVLAVSGDLSASCALALVAALAVLVVAVSSVCPVLDRPGGRIRMALEAPCADHRWRGLTAGSGSRAGSADLRGHSRLSWLGDLRLGRRSGEPLR